MSQNAKKMYILGYLGGPEGVFNDQTGPILLSSYPLTHIYTNQQKKPIFDFCGIYLNSGISHHQLIGIELCSDQL